MNRFCPKCGAMNKKFIGSFCQDCYLADHEVIVIPNELTVDFCKRCSRVSLRGKMREQSKEIIKEIILSKLKVKELTAPEILIEITPMADGKSRVLLNVSGKVNDERVSFEKEVLLKPVNVCCIDCSRIAGGYFEAILQVRCPDEMKEKMISVCRNFLEQEKKEDLLATVIKATDEKYGFNWNIGSRQVTFKLARLIVLKYGAKLLTASKTFGVKNGKELKRVTFLLRIGEKKEK